MPVETIAGLSVNVRTLGAGPRPVLALHCSLAHGAAWNALAAEIGHEVTVCAPDLPGHGHTGPVPEGRRFHDVSTEIAVVLAERIGQGQPVDVIGHSFGGTVALRLALERPDLVRSLAMFEPVLFSAAAAAGAPEAAPFLENQRHFADLLAQGRREEAAALFHASWGDGTPLAEVPAPLRAYIVDRIDMIQAGVEVVEDDRPGLVVPGRLEAMDLPVLVAGGSTSPAIIAAINRTLAARIPATRLVEVEGAGHMLPISHAPALAQELRTHLGLAAA